MRRLLLLGGCVGALVAPAGAIAAGGPVPAVQGGPGVRVPGSDAGYVAVRVGRDTVVEQVLRRGGAIGRSLTIRGRYGVPGAAYDNSTTGLSADGRTLVLAQVLDRFPIHRTRLVVLDARRLRVLRRISLPGYYTVDAIAPDGRALYLIRYLRQDGSRYEVRAYDLAAHRLVAAPVVDPREPGEKMRGIPLSRAMSADGRFAYTLYQRPEGAPFIHALDTVRGTAACIDLPPLAGDLSDVRLTLPAGARPLLVTVAGVASLAVDVAARRARPVHAVRPATAPVTAPAPAPAPAPDVTAPARGTARIDLASLAVLAAAVALWAALAVAARRRRRRRPAAHREMPA